MCKKNQTGNDHNIIYVNKEIASDKEDLLGISTQVNSIENAIDDGASMIGIIGDFGSGKSSVGELINKKKFNKIIKINMWDSLRSETDDADDNTLITLDKTFLYQLAFNSGKKNLAKHVNKRLSNNSGFISFTLKSWTFWIYFIIAALLVAFGILVYASNLSFDLLGYVVYHEIYWASYLVAAIFILCGLRKSSIAFSSWKSEGKKRFDSSDAFSIFSEIVDCFKHSKKKSIIIVEDLDRLGKNEYNLIVDFIKQMYRFSNLSKSYFSFIVSIKPAPSLKKDVKFRDYELDYDKVFDYIVELKPIHIDDFNSILHNLITERLVEIKALMGTTEESLLMSEFSLLISGKNLNIRKLKHRLNAAILLYRSLKIKHNNETSNIRMRTCCLVAYLQSQYEESYHYLVSNEEMFNDIVKQSYTIRLDPRRASKDKISFLQNFIAQLNTNKQGVSEFEADFCYDLASYLINGLISDDFRQYFYSYPKGSYIKSIEESELEDLILFPHNDIEEEHLNLIVKNSICRGGKVIDDAIRMLNDRNIVFPAFILTNELLFTYCYNKFPDCVVTLMRKELLWNNENAERTAAILQKINGYDSCNQKQLFESYSEEVASSVAALGTAALECRLRLIKGIRENIEYFSAIFLSVGNPALQKAEIENINNEDILFSLINNTKFNAEVLSAISEKYLKPLSEKNCNKLVSLILNLTVKQKVNEEIATNIVSILTANTRMNKELFEYIASCKEITGEIVEYVNLISDSLNEAYCTIIEANDLLGQFNSNVIDALYNNECYNAFLRNSLLNEYVSDRCFDHLAITEDVVKLLYKVHPELFVEFRKHVLQQSQEIKQSYRYTFQRPYPFVTSDEKKLLSSDDCTALFDEETILNNVDDYMEICNKAIHNELDIYKIALYILEFNNSHAIQMFEQLNFESVRFNRLETDKQQNVLNTYTNRVSLNDAKSMIHYMSITRTLNATLEYELLQLLQKKELLVTSAEEYMDLLNELNDYTDATLKLISALKDTYPLPPKITDELYNRGEMVRFIIAKTLYDKRFEYREEIDVCDYMQVYTTEPTVAEYMIKDQKLLEAIYFSRDYSLLNKEQIFIYNQWNQFYELFKAAMEISDSDDEQKTYIMNVKELATETDNDKIIDYLKASNKFASILLDNEVYEHIKYLLWDTNPWKKASLTKFVNKLKKVA